MTNQENEITRLNAEIKQLIDENRALLKLASHDMRSPLNKIFALVNLVKMTNDPLSEEQEGYLNNMELILSDGLQRMRNLTDLRSIENDQLKVNWQHIDVAALIKKTVREYMPLAERKKLKLVSSIDAVKTMADKLIISRILDQLISNALKFSPANSEIKLLLEAGTDKYWLTVVDGGYGINEEEQAELFQKFKVLSAPTTGGESKTGLGLYIAHYNATLLGGTIQYKNDDGSKFIVELPYTMLA